MTPADLEALGLRVKPLEWDANGDARAGHAFYQVRLQNFADGTWSARFDPPFADCTVLVRNVSREAAITAANAHHATQVAAMIERIDE